MSDGSRLLVVSGKTHGLMTRDKAAELHAQIVSSLPDGRVVVSLPAWKAAGVEVVDPRSKISAAIETNSDLTPFVILFHPDIDSGEAERSLLSLGIERLEHPDLLPSQWLVRASLEQLATLSTYDQVAYIYPASKELIERSPVRGCIGPLLNGGPVAQYVSTIGQGWDGSGNGTADLTYSFERLTERVPGDVIAGIFQRALAEWSKYAAIKFRRGSDPSANRNINVLFAQAAHGDSYPFDGRGRVLAHTFYPAGINPEPIAGDMHLDDDETWSEAGSPDLFSVVLHEIGHALGLAHSDRPGAVMYPYYSTLTSLQADDVAALRRIYAPVAATPTEPEAPSTPSPSPTEPTAPTTPSPSPTVPENRSDSTAPSLTIKVPSSVTYATSAATLRISGTSKDNTGVVSVQWQRGSESGLAAGTTSWSFDLPLYMGANTVIVRAIDAAGNKGWRSVVITRR